MANTGAPHNIHFRGDGETTWPANTMSEEVADSVHAALDASELRTSGGLTLSTATESDAVTVYPVGFSVWSASTGTGWPVNGLLVVRRHSTTGRSTQELTLASTGASTAPTRWVRYWGTGSAWSAWLTIGAALPQPLQATSDTDLGISNTSYSTGSPIVGVSFNAPPGGAVFVTTMGMIASNINTNYAQLAYVIKTGSTIASGTDVIVASNSRAISSSQAVNSGAVALTGASIRVLHTGLTPGDPYNAYTVHRMVTTGSGDVFYRLILVEPVLV